MTIDDLKAYLARLQHGLQDAERNLSEAQARLNMQHGAIAAVQQLIADAQRIPTTAGGDDDNLHD